MKCHKCNNIKVVYSTNLQFEGYTLPGWQCKQCGEEYYEPEQAEKVLELIILKKEKEELSNGKVKSEPVIHIKRKNKTVMP